MAYQLDQLAVPLSVTDLGRSGYIIPVHCKLIPPEHTNSAERLPTAKLLDVMEGFMILMYNLI